MQQCWALSIALGMATHMATVYCSTHIVICHKFAVHGFHLLPTLVRERRTAENVFIIFARAMEALYATWCTKNVAAARSGRSTMSVRCEGVVLGMYNVAEPGFLRVWCGAQQLVRCTQAISLHIPESFQSSSMTGWGIPLSSDEFCVARAEPMFFHL